MANIFGVDLGTGTVKIFNKHDNTIVKEKNTIAVINKNQLYAYGDEAYAMYEKAPDRIKVCFPVSEGVIADYNYMQFMIQEMMDKYAKGHTRGCDFIVSVPSELTEVEKKAFHDMFYKSKMRPKRVLLCDKPIADAIGLGLDVNEPTGVMVVDMGEETTEISVVSLGGIVLGQRIAFGGKTLDLAIISYIKKVYGLVIGRKTATALKEQIGSAVEGLESSMKICGLDLVSGLPIEVEITAEVVYNAMKEPLRSICDDVKNLLEKTPPELAKDMIHSGIYLTGGGSCVTDFEKLLANVTSMRVNTFEDPDQSVVRGLSQIATNDKFTHLAYGMKTKLFR